MLILTFLLFNNFFVSAFVGSVRSPLLSNPDIVCHLLFLCPDIGSLLRDHLLALKHFGTLASDFLFASIQFSFELPYTTAGYTVLRLKMSKLRLDESQSRSKTT